MIIEQFGVKLKRIQYDDIELIRYWRNKPEIRSKMAYRKHITKEEQEKWFLSVNNPYNYYFLIEYNGQNIGVINCKKINLLDGYGEGGIFVWEKETDYDFVPVFASLCLLNAVFDVLKIFNKSFVQILRTNKRAINFNKELGYIILPNQEREKNPYYILTKEDYYTKTLSLNKIATKLTTNSILKVYGEPSENNLSEINKILASNISSYKCQFDA
jgi:hypothetical protein